MKYLKTRKDSDALAYQRHIGKRLKSRARAMNISDPVVMSLSLQRDALDTAIAAELDGCNQQFETLMRLKLIRAIDRLGSNETQPPPLRRREN